MAAENRVSNASKIIASDLLASDIRIPQLLCFAVQAAANKLTGGPDIPFVGTGICVSPIGTPYGVGRSEFATVDKKGVITFYPDDLMVIGGMAIALYDYVIRDITHSRKLPSLKNSLKKNTSDIDMVWWPRSLLSDKVITIHSPAIKDLCDKLIEKIQYEMESTFGLKNVKEMILSHMNNAISFTTEVSSKNSPLIRGAKHICIYFIVTYTNGTTNKLEMCDIAIHDSGSSQLNDSYQLEFMTNDPVYCDPSTEINKLDVNPPFHINVPNMEKVVKQQILALYNLLKRGDNKYIIIYNRLRYIRSLLSPINTHRSNLLATFGISNQKAIDMILQIDTNLNRIQQILLQQSMSPSSHSKPPRYPESHSKPHSMSHSKPPSKKGGRHKKRNTQRKLGRTKKRR